MDIHVNGKTESVNSGTTINQLLAHRGCIVGTCAVAVNDEFVPRAMYDATVLNANDAVEIVSPQQGG